MAAEPDGMIIIHRLSEIPQFANEEEEHRFWSTHDFSDELWNSLPLVPDDELPPPRADQKPRPIKRA